MYIDENKCLLILKVGPIRQLKWAPKQVAGIRRDRFQNGHVLWFKLKE